MRAFGLGGVVGCSISLLLFPLMYFAGLHPRWSWSFTIHTVGSIAWPGSILLMAAHGPGVDVSDVVVFAIAVASNGVLYGVLAAAVAAVARRLRR